MNPKEIVSVIIPVYNVEKYLDDCIRSIYEQTYKNIEIICVNDGSTDRSLQILQLWQDIDKRINIINQKNKGLSAARNTGINAATGDYIVFLDSDDWIDKEFIEKLYSAALKYDADITAATIVRKRKKSEKYRVHYTEEKVYTTLQEKIDICRIPVCCYVWNKLYRTELVKQSLFKEDVCFEDVLWTPEILKRANKLVTVPNINHYYRVNSNSIVKQKASLKKQNDSYNAKKYIVKFFDENNLNLSKKARIITKRIKYLFNIPIIRYKEFEGVETCLLFDLMPISKKKVDKESLKLKKSKKLFLCKILDSHLYINLFSIHLSFKLKHEPSLNLTNQVGISDISKEPKLIVSLTSYPDRINEIHKTISTLLNQDLLPDKVILWLADSQFPNKENDLPNSLLRLKEYGLEIMWCEDLKSYKKLIPALKMFPEDIIVTADDDLFYQKDWLRSLYEEYLKNPNYIYTRRATYLEYNGFNIIKIEPHYDNSHYRACFNNQLMGGAGTLYPPHSLADDVFNIEQVRTLVPTHDDIYFWVMALIKGTKIALVQNKDLNLYVNVKSQTKALCKENKSNSKGISGNEAFLKIFKKYPEIINKIGESFE